MNEFVELKKAYLRLNSDLVVEILGVNMAKTEDSKIFVASLCIRYKDGYIDYVPISSLEPWNFVMEDE